jgi:hypothetical protein
VDLDASIEFNGKGMQIWQLSAWLDARMCPDSYSETLDFWENSDGTGKQSDWKHSPNSFLLAS